MATTAAWGPLVLGRGRRAELGVALGTLVLNAADALFTNRFLQAGLASEANPIMRLAWQTSPGLFLALKLCVVSAGVVWLWSVRRELAAGLALFLTFITYAAVVGYHVLFLGTLVLHLGSAVP